MAGFLKLGDIKGKSSQGYLTYKLTDDVVSFPADSKNRLRQTGLSMQAISQLEAGKLITNHKDMQIIAQIVSMAI